MEPEKRERPSSEHEQVYHAASRCQAASLSLTARGYHGLKNACSVEGKKTGGFASQSKVLLRGLESVELLCSFKCRRNIRLARREQSEDNASPNVRKCSNGDAVTFPFCAFALVGLRGLLGRGRQQLLQPVLNDRGDHAGRLGGVHHQVAGRIGGGAGAEHPAHPAVELGRLRLQLVRAVAAGLGPLPGRRGVDVEEDDQVRQQPVRGEGRQRDDVVSGQTASAALVRDRGVHVPVGQHDRAPLQGGPHHLLDVIGPDEYHERVNNNAYTNMIAKRTFEIAGEVASYLAHKHPSDSSSILSGLQIAEELPFFANAAKQLYVPAPDPESNLIEQFDGYFDLKDVSLDELRKQRLHPDEYLGAGQGLAVPTKVIKQADVVMMLCVFRDLYSNEVKQANWQYYEPRTEHARLKMRRHRGRSTDRERPQRLHADAAGYRSTPAAALSPAQTRLPIHGTAQSSSR